MSSSLPARISKQGDENMASPGSMFLQRTSSDTGRCQSLLSRVVGDLTLNDASRQASIFSRWDQAVPGVSGSSSTLPGGNHDNNQSSTSSVRAPTMLFDLDSDVPVTKSAGLIAKLGLAGQGHTVGTNQCEADTKRGQFGLHNIPVGMRQNTDCPPGLGNGVGGCYRSSYHCGTVPQMPQAVFPSSSSTSHPDDDLYASRNMSLQSGASVYRHEEMKTRRTSLADRQTVGRSHPPVSGVESGAKPTVAKWRRACSFYLRGHCRKEDCEFAHDLKKVTCKFWEMSECFKGSTCPFLHGYLTGPQSKE